MFFSIKDFTFLQPIVDNAEKLYAELRDNEEKERQSHLDSAHFDKSEEEVGIFIHEVFQDWVFEGGFHREQIGYDSRGGRFATLPVFKVNKPEYNEKMRRAFPFLYSFIDQIPNVNFVSFLNLHSGARIDSHKHVKKNLICHVLLESVGDGCTISCNGQTQPVSEAGDYVIFDYSYDHQTYNYTDKNRVNLAIDFTPEKKGVKPIPVEEYEQSPDEAEREKIAHRKTLNEMLTALNQHAGKLQEMAAYLKTRDPDLYDKARVVLDEMAYYSDELQELETDEIKTVINRFSVDYYRYLSDVLFGVSQLSISFVPYAFAITVSIFSWKVKQLEQHVFPSVLEQLLILRNDLKNDPVFATPKAATLADRLHQKLSNIPAQAGKTLAIEDIPPRMRAAFEGPVTDDLRDLALALEDENHQAAYRLMLLAFILRSHGPFIARKIKDYIAGGWSYLI